MKQVKITRQVILRSAAGEEVNVGTMDIYVRIRRNLTPVVKTNAKEVTEAVHQFVMEHDDKQQWDVFLRSEGSTEDMPFGTVTNGDK